MIKLLTVLAILAVVAAGLWVAFRVVFWIGCKLGDWLFGK